MTANTLPIKTWKVESLGYWNGYVGVPSDHPWFKKDYNEALCGHPGCYEHTPEREIDVHGGLTYSGDGKHFGGLGEYWWFGFDTGHSFDDPHFGGWTKDEKFVRIQCENLAKQLLERYHTNPRGKP